MSNLEHISFGKDKTALIKGVAIVFMIVLHVFGGSGWYEPQFDLPQNHNESLMTFMRSFQICVGIYVFLIGYGYAHSKKKDLQYSLKHTKHLLSVYWTILLIFVWPVNTATVGIGGGNSLYLNLLGIVEDLSWVSWFVFLYVWAMLVMPFLARLIDLRPNSYTLIAILVCYISMVVIYFCDPRFGTNLILYSLFVCLSWTPAILLGYLFAREQLFQRIKIPNNWFVVAICVAIIAVTLWLKVMFKGIYIINFDIIYSIFVITALLMFFTVVKCRWVNAVFTQLGDKSVYMWFIHGLFFTASTRHFYQPFIMVSDNLWTIALWTIILSYSISIPLKKVIDI